MPYSGLATYLNDHLAGATAGMNLAEMASEEHRGDTHGAFFAEIAEDIRTDYAALAVIVDGMNVEKSATKTAAAELGSKLMKSKFTGGDDDELNAFVTLETLSIGVEGKACMWRALKTVDDTDAVLSGVQLDELLERAEDQRSRIEAKRLEIAPNALAHTVNA